MSIRLTLLLLSAIAAVLLAGCATPPPTNPVPGSVTIERTTYGVAHITAADYESLAYGTAYARAQDNVCLTAEHLVTVRGERSRYFGAAAQGLLGLRSLSNEQIDFFVDEHMDDAALDAGNSALGADARASMRGYVSGYNRYLADTGVAGLPLPCRGAAWVRPMTVADLYRINELSMTQAGVALLADAVLAARPPSALGAVDEQQPVGTAQAIAALATYRIAELSEGGGIGSNGWAFGRDVTPDGSGVLLGNPHFPWIGENRFWQLHLTIPGRLDVMGAAIGESPVVQIGFNHDVAWTHTVSTGKRFTLYELALVPGDPTRYVVDGQSRRMTPKTLAIEALGADGKLERKETTVWETLWGPVLVVPRAGLTWNTKTAYAIKDANTANTRAIETWMRMNTARSVEELRAALGNQGIPWVNTLAADRNGNALYADLSVVPDLNAGDLQRCAPSRPAAALFAAAGLVVLDGSKMSCGWDVDPSAPVAGLIPAASMPVVVRRDFVQNSNDSYWLSNPAAKWSGISPLVGLEDTPQGLRTRMGLREITRHLAGQSGAGTTKIGPVEIESILFSDRNLAGILVLDDLVAACPTATLPDQKDACRVLASWDRTSSLDASGAPLFREFWRRAREIHNVWRVPFNPTDPINTPSGLNMGDASVEISIFTALGDAVAALRAAGFAPEATLRIAQVKQTNRGPVPVPGGDEFEGVLNKTQTPGVAGITSKGYDITYGSSYIQIVTFDDRGPVAAGMLTYGQSSDPASSFAYDQLEPFSRKQWPALPFHRSDIEAQRIGPQLVIVR